MHAFLSSLDDELLIKEHRLRSDRRAADLGHQVTEEELVETIRFAVAFGDKVAVVADIGAQCIRAGGVHLRMNVADQFPGLVAEHLKLTLRDDALKNKKAVV